MMGSKCGGRKKICAVSFGLALGVTCALAVLLWMLWITTYGPTHMMVLMHMPVPTWNEGGMEALWCLIKGFVFGYVLALLYGLFSCCCPRCKKCHCCGSTDCRCAPGCACGCKSEEKAHS